MTAEVKGKTIVHSTVQVTVADVNDNPPQFKDPPPRITVVEEDETDLPLVLTKVSLWIYSVEVLQLWHEGESNPRL